MQVYDLCLTWYWLYDEDFASFVAEAACARGISIWQIVPANLLQAVSQLHSGEATFRTLLERAADDLRFEPIRRHAIERDCRRLNPAEISRWAEDKATMHLELIQAGVQMPYTIILPPYVSQPVIDPPNIEPLGSRFVLKPAVGGGGEGVRLHASSLEDILRARLEFPDQKYLVQEYIQPRVLAGREAWFRIFYVGGACFPCWWHPVSHIYGMLTPQQEAEFKLEPLRETTGTLARVSGLDWFSTEIVLASDGRCVVVDPVNDGIDTRIQSKALDGVPDQVMRQITDRLVELAAGAA